MRRVLVLTVTSVVMVLGLAACGSAAESQDIFRFDGKKLPRSADATLVRGDGAVSVAIETKVDGALFDLGTPLGGEWKVGDATTMWFVTWNNPDGCTDGCGEDEILAFFDTGDNPAGVGVHYATGSVATNRSWNAAATLAEGDDARVLAGDALEDAGTAEVHVVVRTHGQASSLTADELVAALTTLSGGCAVNLCGDAQAAVFLAP